MQLEDRVNPWRKHRKDLHHQLVRSESLLDWQDAGARLTLPIFCCQRMPVAVLEFRYRVAFPIHSA